MEKMCLLLLILLTSCSSLQPGDLLFHVANSRNAITDVTPGMIDHVAIVIPGDSVIEAVPRGGVRTTPLDTLRRQEGYYMIGKVRGVDRSASIANARRYLGQAYDHFFLADNKDIYCSELVQFSFVDRHGQRLFAPIPMSFHDSTGQITPYWQQFYQRHDMQVPESMPGTNPGELSQRALVHIKGRLR